jgi:hypothetical protein
MVAASPRVDPRLVEAARGLDDPAESMAETWRQVCLVAERMNLTRPGYDSIRIVVRNHRRRREEVRRLLTPVVVDFLRGRMSAWDVEQAAEAAAIVRAARQSRHR